MNLEIDDLLKMIITQDRIAFTDSDPRSVPELQFEAGAVNGKPGIVVRGYPYDTGNLSRNQVHNLVGALSCWLERGSFQPEGYNQPFVIKE